MITNYEQIFLEKTFDRVAIIRSRHERLSWDAYFMNIALSVASRTTCDRGLQGCVIASNHQILATGYAGSPPGFDHCDAVGHHFHIVRDDDGVESKHCVRTIHAEENAILQAAKRGIALSGGVLYCTITPCFRCAMKIVGVGIVRVVCFRRYHRAKPGEIILAEAGIALEYLTADQLEYPQQKPE